MVVVLSDRAFGEVLLIQVFLLVIGVEVFLLFCSCSKMCHQSGRSSCVAIPSPCGVSTVTTFGVYMSNSDGR